MCCASCLRSPCTTLKTSLTQWIVQSKARMRYRLDRWRASRARHRYLRRQAKVVGVLSPRCLSQRLNENALAREAVGESDAELAQYLKDERIALFLQNDEFMNELRTNREFINSLQEDYKEGQSEYEDEDYEGEGDRGHFTEHLDDATLRERISTMGKASRKKFAQIAKVFSRRKRTSGRSILPGASGGDLLIQNEEEEKEEERPLPVTEDEDSTANNIR